MMKYILFDLDGTLTDPAVGILSGVRYALDYFGIEYGDDESLFCYIGPPLRESFRDYAGLSENDAEIAVKKYREYYSVTGVKQNKLYDGVTRMLEELKSKGFVLSLATSKPTAFAKVILEDFGIDKFFSFVAGSEFDGTRDKKADVVEYALSSLGAEPSDAVMVGDRLHDVNGAAAHGVKCIGVTYGYGTREELCSAGAYTTVDSPLEIVKAIENM